MQWNTISVIAGAAFDIFCWCTAVALPQSETNGLNTGLFLSLPTWLHPATREEVHSDPERGWGGLRVPPSCFPQGHNLLVERGWAPERQQEVSYCMHHCSCSWWHPLKGVLTWSFSFLGLIVIYASAQGDFGGQCSQWSQPSLVQIRIVVFFR